MKKRLQLLIAALVPVIATACNAGNVNNESSASTRTVASVSPVTGAENISNEQLQTLLNEKVTLVDIRRPEEWAQTGVVPGSKKLTFFSHTGAINPNLVSELRKIAPNDKPVALICRTGNRTQAAAQIMSSQLGYNKVYNVTKGITHWIAENRSILK